jgi:hypothetical protein
VFLSIHDVQGIFVGPIEPREAGRSGRTITMNTTQGQVTFFLLGDSLALLDVPDAQLAAVDARRNLKTQDNVTVY